jgi:5-formyltetrahydrofolate cyclo-ligase
MSIDIMRIPAALCEADIIIRYRPLSDEANPDSFLVYAKQSVEDVIIPVAHTIDPFVCAREIVAAHKTLHGCILVPGRRFDWSGTRIGRGGGWYDRFLSKIPTSWTRIGVTRGQDVSDERLIRQSWDEPMDWLFIETGGVWRVHETNARLNDMPHDRGRLPA